MAIEIEKKFLVKNTSWKPQSHAQYMVQGYLYTSPECTIRIRIAEDQAFLTLKGASTGISRAEYEYPIPLADARAMLASMAQKPCIEKIRHTLVVAGSTWEIDEFLGENKGLIVAEIELENENQLFAKPDWLGAEVSEDPRYTNAMLVQSPYSTWKNNT